MKSLIASKIYHKRFLPVVNEFTYFGFYLKFSLDNIKNLNSIFFGVNKFNLFSFYEKDHGYRDGTSLEVWANHILKEGGIDHFKGQFILQTFPRVLGYVFNPISFWYCYQDKKLIAIICEVNNTFGETHSYLLQPRPDEFKYKLLKKFHVSPFFEVAGHYQFDFTNINKINIDYFLNHNLQLHTSINGEEKEWSDQNLLKFFFKYPFFTLAIVFLIHYQAMKLFFKKIKFYTHPKKPNLDLTYEHLE